MSDLNAINEFMKKVSEDKALEEKALKVKKECGTTGKSI